MLLFLVWSGIGGGMQNGEDTRCSYFYLPISAAVRVSVFTTLL